MNFEAPPLGCELTLNAWYAAQNGVAGLSVGLLIFLSFAAGLFLGVPVVARELERGTARLAWSLAPSRMRWYLARLLPLLVLLAIVTFLAGIAADRFVAATTDGDRPGELVHGVRLPGSADRQPRGLRLRRRASPSGAIVARALPGDHPRGRHRDDRPGRWRAGPPADPGVGGRRDPDGS